MTYKLTEMIQKLEFKSSLKSLSVLALLALSFTVFLGKANDRLLQAMDSSVHARIALDMTHQGSLKPILPASKMDLKNGGGHWVGGFNDHPFPMFYLNGHSMRFFDRIGFGANSLSAKLLPALMAVGCIVLTLLLGLRLYQSFTVGLVAALILVLTPQFIGYGARFHLDAPLTFGILLSFLGWVSGSIPMAALGVFVAHAMKGPLAFLLFPAVVLSWVFLRKFDFTEIKKLTAVFVLSMVLCSLVWFATAHFGSWDLVKDYWYRQVFGTAVEARGQGSIATLPLLGRTVLKYFPWFLGLFYAIRKPQALLVSASFILLAVFCAIRFKYEHYLYPIYPFLALWIAGSFRHWIVAREEKIQKTVSVVGFGFVIIAFVFPVSFGKEKFPQLKAFIPTIQKNGTIADKILYVGGEQPYGSFGDYRAVLSFYTNRQVFEADCKNINAQISALQPVWIVLGKSQISCMSVQNIKIYSSNLNFENQMLLSRTSFEKIELFGTINVILD